MQCKAGGVWGVSQRGRVLRLIKEINMYRGEFVIKHFFDSSIFDKSIHSQRPLSRITASQGVGASFHFALVGKCTVSSKEQTEEKKKEKLYIF